MRVEDCPFRHQPEGEGRSETAGCRLLEQLSSARDGILCRIRRDACEACCASPTPSPEQLNPVVAALLFHVTQQVIGRGGVSGCGADQARRLQSWAEQSLAPAPAAADGEWLPRRPTGPCYYLGGPLPWTANPSAADDGDRLPVFGCGHPARLQTTVAECRRCLDWTPRTGPLDIGPLPVPPPTDAPPVRWAVAVCAGGGADTALEWCLDSLGRAGWPEARLFGAPGVMVPDRFRGLPISLYPPGLAPDQRFLLLVGELLMRQPDADALLIVSDRVVLDDRDHLRPELERVLASGNGARLLCLCGPPGERAEDRAWYAAGAGHCCEELALVLPNGLARQLLTDLGWFERHAGRPAEPMSRTVQRWAAARGLTTEFPRPGLAWPLFAGTPERACDDRPVAGPPRPRGAGVGSSAAIIVPTWNCGPYLSACLDSLLRQDAAAEIVVVDDASTDATPHVLRAFDGRIRTLRHPERRGANAARNTGLRATSSEFIAFADADDEYAPDWLSRLLDAARADRRVGVAYCGFTKLFADGTTKAVRGRPWNLQELWFGNYVAMCSVVRRAALPRDGLPDGFRPFDDWRQWLRMASEGWVGACVADCLFTRRIRAEGKTLVSQSRPVERARETAALRRRYSALVGLDEPLAVVIPAHGCGDLTVNCLTHLADFAGVPLTVCYADNGSPDQTVREIEGAADRLGLPLTVLRNRCNDGFTPAVNRGIRESSAGHVLVLNNDCFVGPGCVEMLAWHLLRNPRVAAVGPLTGDQGGQSLREIARCRAAGVTDSVVESLNDPVTMAGHLRLGRGVREEPVLAFFCALLHRAALDRCGPLDNRLYSGLGADDEWCRRVRSRGWRVLLALDAYAAHLHKESFRRLGIDRDALQRQARSVLDEISGVDHAR